MSGTQSARRVVSSQRFFPWAGTKRERTPALQRGRLICVQGTPMSRPTMKPKDPLDAGHRGKPRPLVISREPVAAPLRSGPRRRWALAGGLLALLAGGAGLGLYRLR